MRIYSTGVPMCAVLPDEAVNSRGAKRLLPWLECLIVKAASDRAEVPGIAECET